MHIKFLQPLNIVFLFTIPVVLYLFWRYAGEKAQTKTTIAVIVRSIIILILVLSLSGLALSESVDRVNVMYLLDMSDSVDGVSKSLAKNFITDSLDRMGDNDTAGLIVFGKKPQVEIAPQENLRTIDVQSHIETDGTNIAAAIQMAFASFPEIGEKRIVLISDGNENRGDALEAAAIARSLDIQIYSLPLSRDFQNNEVYVREIYAPPKVKAGEVHEFSVVIHSLQEVEARISIMRDGELVGFDEVRLAAGENRLSYTNTFTDKGLHTYEVLLDAQLDTIPQNNRSQTFVRVFGEPSVFYVSESGKASLPLLNALTAQGIHVQPHSIDELPDTLSGFIQHDVVILDNVSGFDLSLTKMEAIERYVKDTGGGLLMIGGENSYGVGGYYRTPVERALPVDTDVSSSLNIPSLSLVMIVDKSGSMGGRVPKGETKLDVVKAAAFSATELLNPFHKVGLLAFDADFEWTVPIVDAGQRERIADQLFRLQSGGGTKLYNAIQEGYQELAGMASSVKHMIVLSDGLAEEQDFKTLVSTIQQDRITISTVAVGEDSDQQLMKNIARWGGGRSYYTEDPEKIPRIFTTETIIVSRGLIVEESFFPYVTSRNEILGGIDPTGIPPLRGFVLTYLKPGAELLMAALDNSPLLAVRRYGLGKSAAFTSDLKGKWGLEWTMWENYPRLVSQLMRWIERPQAPQSLQVELTFREDTGTISVDALDEAYNYINYLTLQSVQRISCNTLLICNPNRRNGFTHLWKQAED